MRDERRNSGEYYPGGRVIARPGTAPQQVVVQWSDVQNKPQVAPLPERYKDSDVKTKINEIASKFATVVVAAFVVWTACADVTVQKKRKDEIYNDELVVVDVSGEGVGINTNAVEQIANVAVMTNALTVATTNRVAALETATNSLTSSVSGLQSSKADKSTTYTKSETEVKLAGKANKNGDSIEDFAAKDINSIGMLTVSVIACGGEIHADGDINGFDDDGTLHHLSQKADRAESGDADELATLDADGNPTRSGIAKTNVATKSDLDEKLDSDDPVLTPTAPSPSASNTALAGAKATGAALANKLEEEFADDYETAILSLLSVGGGANGFILKRTLNSVELRIGPVGDPYTLVVPMKSGTLALTNDIASAISADDPAFSNAVLSVGINTNVLATVQEIQSLGTNTVHQIADFVSAFDGIGITLPQGGLTLAGLLAALVAAVTWLKKTLGKVADNSGKPTDDFAGELLGKQVAKDAIAYKVATVAGENRSVKVYAVNTGNIEFSVAPPSGATGVIDYEVWLDARLVSALPTITINGTYTTNTGKTILEGCAAGVINIIHCTFVEGTGVTAVVAQFKGVTA